MSRRRRRPALRSSPDRAVSSVRTTTVREEAPGGATINVHIHTGEVNPPAEPKVSAHHERITDAVKLALDEKGVSVFDLADSTGIGILRIRNRMALLAPWSIDELDTVADVLRLPVVTLLACET